MSQMEIKLGPPGKGTPPLTPNPAGEVHIIDADPGVGELLVELLENQFQVKTFGALADFKKAFLSPPEISVRPDLVLCDAKLQDAKGLEVLRFVRQTNRTIPFIFMVNHPDAAWTNEAFKAGVTDLLEKPFESFLFIDKFRGRIEQSREAQKQNRVVEVLEIQTLLLTTHFNRLIDKAGFPASKRLRYAAHDEDKVRFQHARKGEDKLLPELEECRNEYLKLAPEVQKS